MQEAGTRLTARTRSTRDPNWSSYKLLNFSNPSSGLARVPKNFTQCLFCMRRDCLGTHSVLRGWNQIKSVNTCYCSIVKENLIGYCNQGALLLLAAINLPPIRLTSAMKSSCTCLQPTQWKLTNWDAASLDGLSVWWDRKGWPLDQSATTHKRNKYTPNRVGLRNRFYWFGLKLVDS